MILARSPFFVNCPATDVTSGTPAYCTLEIAVYSGTFNSAAPANYTLRKDLTGTPSQATFEVGELIRDFIDNNFNGDYFSNSYWVNLKKRYYDSSNAILMTASGTVISEYDIAVNGYSYFNDGSNYNPFPAAGVSITNTIIYTLRNQLPNIPVFAYNTSIDYYFLKDNVIIESGSLSALGGISQDSTLAIKYITQDGIVTYDNYIERVNDDGGTYESSFCLKQFFDSVNTFNADQAIIEFANSQPTIYIDLKYFDECKYTPYKVVFTNRFGAEQEIFMSKKSIERIDINDEVFKFNTIDASGSYDINTPQYTRFSVGGRESLTLNTPFLPEDYNEVIKQLMLTENAWLVDIDTNEVNPIIPKTKNLTYKTSVNDRLTQYTIEFDYAYDTINSVR